MTQQSGLDFVRINPISLRIHLIIASPCKGNRPIFAHRNDIARDEPTATKSICHQIGLPPIAKHQTLIAGVNRQVSRRAAGDRHPVFIDDRYAPTGLRPTDVTGNSRNTRRRRNIRRHFAHPQSLKQRLARRIPPTVGNGGGKLFARRHRVPQ